MDTLHATIFYVSAALSVVGGLFVAFLPDRPRRAIALAVAGVGVAGLELSLFAGFAAMVTIVAFAASAALLGRADHRAVLDTTRSAWRQVGAVAAAVMFAALAYSAFRGDFERGPFFGGTINGAAVGRLLFAHDALALEAVGTIVVVAVSGAVILWRSTQRPR